jgi:hypothetical protein
MVSLVNPAELPRQLGAIHLLPIGRVFDLARDRDTLVQVLETDHAWLKQATPWIGCRHTPYRLSGLAELQ